jgi:alpha-L-fucosidase
MWKSRACFHVDVIPTFKGERFDPEHLMDLYQKAGAKYFVSMGVHHDNFDLWNSKHTRWNAMNMGPKKDIVGLFRQAALKRGLKFGVSEHLWISYKWFGTSHDSDKDGPLAGVPYDGNDPKYVDLYHDLPKDYPAKFSWDDAAIPDRWKKHWFDRIKDLVDNYQPDLLYTDGALPFEEYGMNLVAHLYNENACIGVPSRNPGVILRPYMPSTSYNKMYCSVFLPKDVYDLY